jgi:hypothetical protein
MNRWLALLTALLLTGCTLPFGLSLGRATATLEPVTIVAPATASVTPLAATLTATATMTPTATLTLTPTSAPTITPTATISLLMPPALTLIAKQTAAFVAPFATGRPTVAIELPLVTLPTRDALTPAPTLTSEVRPVIPPPGETPIMPGTVVPPPGGIPVTHSGFVWEILPGGFMLQAKGTVKNVGTVTLSKIVIDIGFRNVGGTLVATAQALAEIPAGGLKPGQETSFKADTANPGGVVTGEVLGLNWEPR